MSGKKRSRKELRSLEKQIELHKEKLAKAIERGNVGLANYYEKEMKHFEEAAEKLERRLMPKRKRKR